MEKPVMRPEFWVDLGAACPHGPQEDEIVKAWFALKWPVYKTYGYKRHTRAIANWWSRVSLRELDEAERYLAACNEVAMTKRLDALYLTLNKPVFPDEEPKRRFAVLDGGRGRG